MEQLCLQSFRLIIAHRFLIGLRYGEFPVQPSTFIPDCFKKFCVFFEQRQGARSCWKKWTFWRGAVWHSGHQIVSHNVHIFIWIHHAFNRDQSARSWSRKKSSEHLLGRMFSGLLNICFSGWLTNISSNVQRSITTHFKVRFIWEYNSFPLFCTRDRPIWLFWGWYWYIGHSWADILAATDISKNF